MVEIAGSEGRRRVHKQTKTGKGEGGKEEGMTERNRQKEREISASTVTNKSLQHDRRLLKHFISPQHNGVLLPIICSVSARVDIKWGAAAFSCHFSAVSPLPWRCGCFFAEPGCKQGLLGVNGAGRGGAQQDRHCHHAITMQRADDRLCALLWLSQVLTIVPSSSCISHYPAPFFVWWQQFFLLFCTSAAATRRLLEAMMNWASQRPLSILRNINIPKILIKKLKHNEVEFSPLPPRELVCSGAET